ncbi:ferritin-like domain-containing protein [Luteolibacter sp. SL250]|uniref:ferritin-like domain-containing protein n=1 Tax=Luteolibacter sp. SL250 TaxID=2995170 RepID=UPI0022718852|nr:ferritin-like domain-containing protein [Luteolibacter sp. SL250]WAC19074.1 ferritin-like domain-containing protein [Luteolibacter sp. SL250]
MPEIITLEDLLVHCIKDLHSAETQLVDALPKLAAAPTDPALADAFANHLKETKSHVIRLEQAAELLGASPHGVTCKGMEGLIAEGREILRMEVGTPLKDLALTGAARKVEHYEIASYCAAKELAEACGNLEVVALLQTTEEEEKSAEKLLMALGARAVAGAPSASNPIM